MEHEVICHVQTFHVRWDNSQNNAWGQVEDSNVGTWNVEASTCSIFKFSQLIQGPVSEL